jgi:hypothetical protein
VATNHETRHPHAQQDAALPSRRGGAAEYPPGRARERQPARRGARAGRHRQGCPGSGLGTDRRPGRRAGAGCARVGPPPTPAPATPAAADKAKGTEANAAETVIVTGTARREGLRKPEASFSRHLAARDRPEDRDAAVHRVHHRLPQRLKNSQSQQFTNAGNTVERASSKATGVEFEASIKPMRGLTLELTGNYQKSEFTDFGAQTGNLVPRQPRLAFRFTPSYRLPTDVGTFRFFGTYSHIGERLAANNNVLRLPAYKTLDAGLVAQLNNGIEVRVTGTNLTNEIGLTEGNFRAPGTTADENGVFLARPLFGRACELSVGFAF